MTPEKKAQEIVRKWEKKLLTKRYSISGFVILELAIACAITEVEGKIADLKAMHDEIPDFKWFILHRIEEQEAILQELKNMNQ